MTEENQCRLELQDIDTEGQVEKRVSRFQTFIENAIRDGDVERCELYIDHGT